jgi:hypothetical protein
MTFIVIPFSSYGLRRFHGIAKAKNPTNFAGPWQHRAERQDTFDLDAYHIIISLWEQKPGDLPFPDSRSEHERFCCPRGRRAGRRNKSSQTVCTGSRKRLWGSFAAEILKKTTRKDISALHFNRESSTLKQGSPRPDGA